MKEYYNRVGAQHSDGTRLFQSAVDSKRETGIAALLAEKWRCEIRQFGAMAPVDWFAIRHGRMEAVLELKSRNHTTARYPTVFLNCRKWLALMLASFGFGVPAVFVVRFDDGVRWIGLTDIDSEKHRIGGCFQIVKSISDIEPVIEVPIQKMKSVSPAAVDCVTSPRLKAGGGI